LYIESIADTVHDLADVIVLWSLLMMMISKGLCVRDTLVRNEITVHSGRGYLSRVPPESLGRSQLADSLEGDTFAVPPEESKMYPNRQMQWKEIPVQFPLEKLRMYPSWQRHWKRIPVLPPEESRMYPC
jgi:hypothetical protein